MEFVLLCLTYKVVSNMTKLHMTNKKIRQKGCFI